MNENDLRSLLARKEKEVESARTRRGIKLLLSLSVLYFATFFVIERPSGSDLLALIPTALICSVIQIVVAVTIFWPVFKQTQSEDKMIADLRKQINEEGMIHHD